MLLVTPQLPTKRVLVPYRILSIQNRLFKIGVYSNSRQYSYVLHFVLNQWLNSSLDKSNLLFLGQCDYYSTCPSNKLYLQGSFFLASQGCLIRVLDGYQISPRTLSYCLGFLALTLLIFSLSKVSLKARSALYYYCGTRASSDLLSSYQKRPSSLPLPQRLVLLI